MCSCRNGTLASRRKANTFPGIVVGYAEQFGIGIEREHERLRLFGGYHVIRALRPEIDGGQANGLRACVAAQVGLLYARLACAP
jgi:hypothetical protein